MKKFFIPVGTAILLLVAGQVFSPKFFQHWSRQGEIDPKFLTGVFDLSANKAVFNNRSILPPGFPAEGQPEPSQVLGKTTQSKTIFVDLANQHLYAYEGGQLVYNFLISSGKWGRTPTGVFRIWVKLRYTLMSGGSTALGTYYYLPNVPYTMFFANDEIPNWRGFGIHGTYWHDNFGHPMSHGCINMRTEEAALLYYWAQPDLEGKPSVWASEENPGTEIVIFGTAPSS